MASEGNTAPAIGIDLGTTYSRVAVWYHDYVEIIHNEVGNSSTPSCVAFTEDEMLVGEAAMNQIDMNPTNTVLGVERLIGKSIFETSVQNEINHWPFKVVSGPNGRLKIDAKYHGVERQFFVEEILSMILAKMKGVAEAYCEYTIKRAVITVPAYFNDLQRQATKDAGALAGLNIMCIIDKPIAAAIAYYFGRSDERTEAKNLLVFDIGYSTCDVSLLSIRNGNYVVRATAGDAHLGGDDFDEGLVHHCVEEFKRKCNIDITRNMRSLRRLRSACERAKRTLSFTSSTTIDVECDFIDFSTHISQARFEVLNMNLFMRIMNLIERCLSDAKIDKTGVDVIVPIGYSTWIPMMQKLLTDFFEGKELFKGMNRAETVAFGAAIKAAKLNGQVEHRVFVGAPPLSLGVGTRGTMTVVVPRKTPIPTEKQYVLTTTIDDQTSMAVPIYEGESAEIKYNKLLGCFGLCGIHAAPKGIPQIDIFFHIDANGILTVSAEDKSSGSKNRIVIGSHYWDLTPEEIQSMGAEAVSVCYYKAEQELKARVSLEDYACKVKAMAKDPGLSASEKKSMEVAAENVKEWLDRNQHATIDEISERQGELETTMRRLMKLKRGGIPYDQILLLSRGT